jgi:tetratricopeptide (TPR) repeat protein
LAGNYASIGNLRRATGHTAAAVESLRQAVFHNKHLVAANENDLDNQSELGGSLNDLGLALAANQQYAEAIAAYQEAIGHQTRAFEKAKQVPQYRHFLTNHYVNLAILYRNLNRPAEAAEASQRGCEL